MTRTRRAALIVVALALVVSMTTLLRASGRGAAPGADTRQQPYYRFVDAGLRQSTVAATSTPSAVPQTADWPVAAIKDEFRYVLASPAHDRVLSQMKVLVPMDGRLAVAAVLPPALRDAARIVMVPQVRIADHWTRLATAVARVESTGTDRVAHADLALPRAAAGTTVDLDIDGVALSGARATSERTAPVRIPAAAAIEFGLGILEPAWPQGPVRFELKVCDGERCETAFADTLDPRAESGQAWQQRRVSLDRFAGTTRSFQFDTHLTSSDAPAFSFPVWANPTVYAPVSRSRDDVNIILLSIDTLRADQLTSYGNPRDTAPFIDDTFAKGGTIFDHCVAAAATTPPSHMTMFTSLQPCVHGLKLGLETIPPWLVTLAETLRAAGFETGAITEDGTLGMSPSFRRGFNSYAENKSANMWFPEGQVAVTFAKAREWLARHHDQRFFLFLHTFQVHAPYTPPRAYLRFFGEYDGHAVTGSSPQHIQDLIAYDREIRYTDDELRGLCGAIQDAALSRNTIFILTSDHGEEFLEHGLTGHGEHLYEEVSHVPLMLWGPGRIPRGQRIGTPVAHIDLMPTILDLAGVAKPAELTGASLVDLVRGAAANPERERRPLFSEASFATFEQPRKQPAYLVQIGRRKVLRSRANGGGAYEFYDLDRDAGEHTNLYRDGAAGMGDMRALLDGYENTCQAQAIDLARRHERSQVVSPERAHLDPEHEEKLRALGYIK